MSRYVSQCNIDTYIPNNNRRTEPFHALLLLRPNGKGFYLLPDTVPDAVAVPDVG